METIRTGEPPQAEEVCRWTLDGTRQLTDLRARLLAELDEDAADFVDQVVLVATELATNALRHGEPPTTVRLLRDSEQLVVDVADHDPEAIPELAPDRPLNGGGRGLLLARWFSQEVGWYAVGDVKHVWAAFARTGAGRARPEGQRGSTATSL
ncbi:MULTISPECIES: ATP-binding protein [Actinoplanes]|uniref:ATP-binding protein n=1 Tax=Actinoplanes TaxID=1865 RepID=UPI0005F282EC|nr:MULTISPECIES: ATP-binding protein [Actinoplanes]GLY08155.1 hypothetical protein Acsp01_85340 [Actinoplanes sp. NBRC 101535]